VVPALPDCAACSAGTCDDLVCRDDVLASGQVGWPSGGGSLSLIGLRFFFRSTGRGTLHCQRCGGDRPYHRCTGRRWFHVLHIPVIPLDRVGEHVQCRVCRTRYRVEVLALPTIAAMQAALPAGSLAAATTMLRAGDPSSPAARSRAVDMVRIAGLASYDEDALTADLAAADGRGLDIAEPLTTLAVQLTMPAPEWFLADAVRVGLADGQLSEEERGAVRLIAAHLGMTAAQAHGVIAMTEESAAAG
jgi:tellurite resistance protein